ncbi:glycoside hydrolase [Hydrogenophaga crassostreae]|uniref:Alpha-galactosidase n=1 Tax=Hydrogenophaga crassostreae TaxID=1763535 RepID=A0A167GTA0_9BURK|nr:alpha-galactosidase [Hydrogenophaga crassostreae]AOW11760.1 alpha-galactosidase [Hydrogenophaga crassostreae]OAD39852.1 glycoside hydrolase [Hydrogenophaga crassostreae]
MSHWFLHGPASSLLLSAPEADDLHQAPVIRYWGARLPDAAAPATAWHEERASPPSSLDEGLAPTVFPSLGFGDASQPGLRAHRQGQSFGFAADRYTVTPDERHNSLRIQLLDSANQIEVHIDLRMDASDTLHIGTRLINQGTVPLQVNGLASANLSLPGQMDTVHSFHGQWSNEFQWQCQPLARAQWRQENRSGRTSHQMFPGAVIANTHTGWHSGACYGAHLAWSGNFAQTIDTLDDGLRQWQLGVAFAPGELALAPGDSFDAPTVLASFSPAGRNGLMQNFHATMRATVQWPGGQAAPRPVHLNTWEAVYFDHRLDDLKDFATQAARLGVERFILDDGWFHGRHDDRSSLGDWWPDAGKYPDGLGPLAHHVTGLGMQFGLWVEPEMVNPDSELYRAHPEWAFAAPGRRQQTWRHQLVLNTALPAVQDYLFEKLDALLSTLPISYLKWDMNRDLTQAVGADGRAGYLGFVKGLYALLARVRTAHPNVEIESCASGGGRMDAGVLAHTHRFWTSDNTDALSRVGIQRGALQFFPPELLGAHIGPAPYHTTGRTQSLDFRAGVALPLHLGIELDVRAIEDGERAQLAPWLTLYKSLRGQLHQGAMWLGECGDHIVWQAHGNAQDLIVFTTRTAPTEARHSPPLILPMLDAAASYRVTRLDPPGIGAANAGIDAPMHLALRQGETVQAHGAWLSQAGLPLPRMSGEAVHIYRLQTP